MDNSVDSLLALLRSTQDGPPPQPTTSNSNTSNTRQVPSSSQLSDLLTSLNARPAPRPPKQGGADQAQGRARKDILEPFGPVGVSARPSVSPVKRSREDTSRGGNEEEGSFGRVRQVSRGESFDGGQVKSARVEEPALDEMSFGKALPVITRLLEDDNLKTELRKMKQDQDSLERRLWAKQEKLKGDHERQTKAEREIAKIARKPIPPEKTKQWSRSLSTALSTFYTQQCIPSIDGLAFRQRQRLKELGVPGLGREDGVVDEKVKQRIKRIMEVLEGGLED